MDPSLCGARTRDGSPCDKSAGWGTGHVGHGRCRLHGGSSPNAEVAGQVWLAHREALVMGIPLDVHPHEALLECIRIAAGEVSYASERIAELEESEAVGHVTSRTTRPLKLEKGAEDMDTMVDELRVDAPQLHVWIVVRQKAMDRLVTYSATALKAGIEERMVRLAEQEGEALVRVIRGVLTELGVQDRPEVPSIVRRQLTLVAGQAA